MVLAQFSVEEVYIELYCNDDGEFILLDYYQDNTMADYKVCSLELGYELFYDLVAAVSLKVKFVHKANKVDATRTMKIKGD